jgi:beta-mannosidase
VLTSTGATTRLHQLSLTTAAGRAWTVRAPAILPAAVPASLADTLAEGMVASVPGEVYADLLGHGHIPDPFDGANERDVQWIGDTDWSWTTTFAWTDPAGPGARVRHDLVLEGLDTVAVVRLNGVEVGRAANQHRTHRFDVGAVLEPGDNVLEVTVEAPYSAAERLAAELGPRPKAYDRSFNALRKMASAYGWDWGPDLAGAGILGGVAIESFEVRVAAVRTRARIEDEVGVLDVEVDLDWAVSDGSVALEVGCAGTSAAVVVPARTDRVALRLEVPGAQPWWPRGYGDQPLVEVTVRLDELVAWERRVGFRTVGLSTAPDAAGSEFVISVNDRPVYVKGANWIPDDALMSRLDAETYRRSLTDAVDAGMNLLRVWGGGIYEREEFYDLCDELGILVWQDFLFACAAYSEEEPLRSEVEAEAREAISRLSSHASLALWNGNNENIWGYVDWGWRAELAGATWGEGYYTDLLPRLVAELAPGTPYTPGSPFSFAPYHYPNDPRHGSMHIWDVWNARDYATYAHYEPRFVSEFGFQGPAAWSTLTSVVHDQPLDPYGPQMLVHQKAKDGNLKLARGLGDHLPAWPESDGVAEMDDWHWITQLNQARAIAFGIAHFRSLFPHNRGTIVWQLNDNWPVVSWAAVDAHGIRKPLWYALRAVYADRFATVQRRRSGPESRHKSYVDLSGSDHGDLVVPTVVLHNDHDDPWVTELVVNRRGTGEGSPVLAEQRRTVTVPARSRLDVDLDDAVRTPDRPGDELIEVVADGASVAFGYFVEDTAMSLLAPTAAYDVTAVRTDRGADVTVRARALVKDLAIFPDRLDPRARVDSGLVTLVAGQQHTFVVESTHALDLDALAARPVLRSVNDLLTPG